MKDHLPSIDIAHTGDLHLGYSASWAGSSERGINQREDDLYQLMSALTDHIVASRPTVWIVAGDAFHSVDPNPYAEDAMYHAATKAREAGIPMVVIGGNHDVPKSSEASPLVHLDKYFGVELMLEQGHVDVGDELRIHCLPYFTLAAHCEGRRELAEFEIDPERTNVLVAHGYAYGPNVSSPPESVVVPPELIEDQRFAVVMLGHVHQHVQIDPAGHAFYCGALDRLTFGEMDTTPAYWRHRISKGRLLDAQSVPFSSFGIANQPRHFFEVRVAQGERTVDETSRVVLARLEQHERMAGSLARIVVSEADQMLLSSALPEVWRKRFRELGGLHVDIKVKAAESEHVLDVELGADTTLTLDESLRKFLIDAGEDALVPMAMDVLADVQG